MGDSNKCSPEEYLESYYNYYDIKAISYKKWYTILIIFYTTISALIPFTTLYFDTFFSAKYIIAFMGSIATIVSSLSATFGFHKKWIEYRTTAEILKFHMCLYINKFAPYNGEHRGNILVSNVRSIVETENKIWRAISYNNKKTNSEK
ncbi:DUF4231 domain-containing protein [Clostridium sp. BJN0013]|uniref:DUF4231 domain-containing protein n=1 Tax=Clostridium sp. BJN0013 TaxID=3236840 RepID=UPI0034C64234